MLHIKHKHIECSSELLRIIFLVSYETVFKFWSQTDSKLVQILKLRHF